MMAWTSLSRDLIRCAPQAARQYRRMLRRALLYTGAGTCTALAAYGLYRLYRSRTKDAEDSGAAEEWELQDVPDNS